MGYVPLIRTVTFRQHRRCANASSRIRSTPEKVSVPASAQPALTVTLIGTTPTFALGALVILAFFATKPPLSSSFTLLEQMGCGLLPMASAVDLACLVRGCCIAAVYKTPHPGAPAKACSYRRRHVRSGRVACRLDDLGAETGLFPGRSDPVAAAAGGLATMRRGGNAIRMARLEIPFDAPLDHARADPPEL